MGKPEKVKIGKSKSREKKQQLITEDSIRYFALAVNLTLQVYVHSGYWSCSNGKNFKVECVFKEFEMLLQDVSGNGINFSQNR